MALLARARWVAGSPCAGKSTAAITLAVAIGATPYSCDDAFDRHAADPAAGPTMRKVTTMPVAERLAQPLDVQVADVFALYREEFPLVLADLATLPGPLVVEGAGLLPELLSALGVPADRAVWLVPTPEFQRTRYAARPWVATVLHDVPDSAWAFDRWMRRDIAFADRVADQARGFGYQVVVVDGTQSPDQLADSVR